MKDYIVYCSLYSSLLVHGLAYLLSAFRDTIKNIMKQFAAIDKPATINIIPEASSAFSWHSTFVPFVAFWFIGQFHSLLTVKIGGVIITKKLDGR